MPDIRVKLGGRTAFLSVVGEYAPGDPPPAGYLDRQEWARIQYKAGLRQDECGRCLRWKFPQELSAKILKTPARTRSGLLTYLASRLCLECVREPGDIEYDSWGKI